MKIIFTEDSGYFFLKADFLKEFQNVYILKLIQNGDSSTFWF